MHPPPGNRLAAAPINQLLRVERNQNREHVYIPAPPQTSHICGVPGIPCQGMWRNSRDSSQLRARIGIGRP